MWTGADPEVRKRRGKCTRQPGLDPAFPDHHVDLGAGEVHQAGLPQPLLHAAVQALRMNREVIAGEDLIKGIKKELRKEGQTIQEYP